MLNGKVADDEDRTDCASQIRQRYVCVKLFICRVLPDFYIGRCLTILPDIGWENAILFEASLIYLPSLTSRNPFPPWGGMRCGLCAAKEFGDRV